MKHSVKRTTGVLPTFVKIQDYMKAHKLGRTAFAIICYLHDTRQTGNITGRELMKICGFEKIATYRAVDQLVAAGFFREEPKPQNTKRTANVYAVNRRGATYRQFELVALAMGAKNVAG